jgi:hypothetical protein
MRGEGIDGTQAEHAGTCTECGAAVEWAAWLDGSLRRLVPGLVSEPIPAGVLRVTATALLGGEPRSWLRPIVATVGVAASFAAAIVVGSQLAGILGPADPGPGASETGAPLASAEARESTSARPGDRIPSCGYPSGIHPPRDPVDVLESLETLGDVPRVAMERHGSTVVSLFARPEGEAQASALCMWFTDASISAGGGGVAQEFPADGPLRLFANSQGGAPTGFHTAYGGSFDPSVVRVEVERSAGDPVDATLGDGYFLASWAGLAYATTFSAYGADGEVIAEIGNNGWDFREQPGASPP